MAKVPKMRPHTKHLNNMYHHFRESVQNNEVTLIAVKTESQLFRDRVLQSTTAD